MALSRFLLMVTETLKWLINLELTCDKQGVKHVGGQTDGGGVTQISFFHTNRVSH